jgi:hypothetical protein
MMLSLPSGTPATVTDGFDLRFADHVDMENCSVTWTARARHHFGMRSSGEGISPQDFQLQRQMVGHPISVR